MPSMHRKKSSYRQSSFSRTFFRVRVLIILGTSVSACTVLFTMRKELNRQKMLDTVVYTYKWSHIVFSLTICRVTASAAVETDPNAESRQNVFILGPARLHREL